MTMTTINEALLETSLASLTCRYYRLNRSNLQAGHYYELNLSVKQQVYVFKFMDVLRLIMSLLRHRCFVLQGTVFIPLSQSRFSEIKDELTDAHNAMLIDYGAEVK